MFFKCKHRNRWQHIQEIIQNWVYRHQKLRINQVSYGLQKKHNTVRGSQIESSVHITD